METPPRVITCNSTWNPPRQDNCRCLDGDCLRFNIETTRYHVHTYTGWLREFIGPKVRLNNFSLVWSLFLSWSLQCFKLKFPGSNLICYEPIIGCKRYILLQEILNFQPALALLGWRCWCHWPGNNSLCWVAKRNEEQHKAIKQAAKLSPSPFVRPFGGGAGNANGLSCNSYEPWEARWPESVLAVIANGWKFNIWNMLSYQILPILPIASHLGRYVDV